MNYSNKEKQRLFKNLISMEELGRLYPDILVEFHQARLAAAGKIFERLFEVNKK